MNIQDIHFPEVIITDKDQVFINTICYIFLQSYNLLCDWHINKTILTYGLEIKIYKKNSK